MKPCCVCSCSLVCDYVAYSGSWSLLSWLTVICFPLYFLPPGINFIRAGEICICSYSGVNMVPHSVFVYFPHLSSAFAIVFPNILFLFPSSYASFRPPMSSPEAPPQRCSSSFSTSVLYSFILLFSPLPSPL